MILRNVMEDLEKHIFVILFIFGNLIPYFVVWTSFIAFTKSVFQKDSPKYTLTFAV